MKCPSETDKPCDQGYVKIGYEIGKIILKLQPF